MALCCSCFQSRSPLVGSVVLWSLGNSQLSITRLKQFFVCNFLCAKVTFGNCEERKSATKRWILDFFSLPIRMI